MNNRNLMLLSGAALGAGAMLFLDARAARRRGAAEVSFARKLQKRVVSELRRVVTHPAEIDVYVSADRRVCLAGRVLMDEADSAVTAVQRLRGINEVDDRLERYPREAFRSAQSAATH